MGTTCTETLQTLLAAGRSLGLRGTRVVLSLIVGVTLAGCQHLPDRINHRHSEQHAERAKSASESFGSVTSDRVGLLPRILSNLEAQRALRSTVATETIRFHDLAGLQVLDDVTWYSLRRELYSALGWGVPDDLLMVVGTMIRIANEPALDRTQRESLLATGAQIALGIVAIDAIERREGSSLVTRGVWNDWVGLRAEQFLDEEISAAVPCPLRPPREPRRVIYCFQPRLPEEARELAESPDAIARLLAALPVASIESGEIRGSLQAGLTNEGASSSRAETLVVEAFPEDIDLVLARTAAPQQSAQAQIDERLGYLAIALKTFEVLVKGERARIALIGKEQKARLDGFRRHLSRTTEDKDDAEGDLEEAKEAGTTPPPGPAAETEHLDAAIELLFGLRRAITSHWRSDQVEALQVATDLRRRLLEAAERSKDPASVYSLVPLAGEGLRQEDLSWLASYIAALRLAVEGKDEESQKFELQIEAMRGAGQDGREEPWLQALSEFYASYTGLTRMLASLALDGEPGPDERGHRNIAEIMGEVAKVAGLLELDLDIASAQVTAQDIDGVADAIARVVQTGEVHAADVRSLLGVIADDESLGRWNGEAEKVLSRSDVQHLASILNDIGAGNTAAWQRVVDLLTRLYGLHMQLREENVRHYMSLASIAGSEVERWETIAGLNRNMDVFYVDSGELLFNGDSAADCSHRPVRSERAATVCRGTDVYSTFRILAATAGYYQTKPLQTLSAIERGIADDSSRRLARAFQIVHAVQLMTTVNRSMAASHSIDLVTEVQEHGVRVEDIVVSSTEAEIAFWLERLDAFHSTGLTQQDLELFVNLVQQGLLAWIGTGVN